jgi:hypothetical protein
LAQDCQSFKDRAIKVGKKQKEVMETVYPEHVMEAVGVVNDFYHSCLDASKMGILAIGVD